MINTAKQRLVFCGDLTGTHLAALRKLRFRYTGDSRPVLAIGVGMDDRIAIVGDPESAAYEWVILAPDGVREYSDVGYGSSDVAMRDGLIAYLGLPAPAQSNGSERLNTRSPGSKPMDDEHVDKLRTVAEILRCSDRFTGTQQGRELADFYARTIETAAAALAARAALGGSTDIPGPYNVDQAKAWCAVCDVLTEVVPEWNADSGTGIQMAVAAIRALATGTTRLTDDTMIKKATQRLVFCDDLTDSHLVALRHLRFRYTDDCQPILSIGIGVSDLVAIVGDPENAAYEWAILTPDGVREYSDCGYGSSDVALRDGLMAYLGMPTIEFCPHDIDEATCCHTETRTTQMRRKA
jgi:hypothetical protein